MSAFTRKVLKFKVNTIGSVRSATQAAGVTAVRVAGDPGAFTMAGKGRLSQSLNFSYGLAKMQGTTVSSAMEDFSEVFQARGAANARLLTNPTGFFQGGAKRFGQNYGFARDLAHMQGTTAKEIYKESALHAYGGSGTSAYNKAVSASLRQDISDVNAFIGKANDKYLETSHHIARFGAGVRKGYNRRSGLFEASDTLKAGIGVGALGLVGAGTFMGMGMANKPYERDQR